ncbi:MAG: hypothetical protein WBW13_15790 [Pseudolabrys sp.]
MIALIRECSFDAQEAINAVHSCFGGTTLQNQTISIINKLSAAGKIRIDANQYVVIRPALGFPNDIE